MLDNEAIYLGRLGENVTDVSQLWSFALLRPTGSRPRSTRLQHRHRLLPFRVTSSLDLLAPICEPISARDTLGPLGYGWRDDWQYSLAWPPTARSR